MARVTIYASVVKAQSLQLARRLIDDVLDEVIVQAKIITLTGEYTTGELSRSIRRTPLTIRGDVVTGEVGSNLPYAHFVHDGTKPHFILPRGNYPLRFYWKKVGHHVRFNIVGHPGQRAKKFLTGPLTLIAARHGWVVYTYGP